MFTNTHLKTNAAREILIAIGIIMTANVFGELVLCGRIDPANWATVFVAVIGAGIAVILFVRIAIALIYAIIVGVATLLPNDHAVVQIIAPEILASHDISQFARMLCIVCHFVCCRCGHLIVFVIIALHFIVIGPFV